MTTSRGPAIAVLAGYAGDVPLAVRAWAVFHPETLEAVETLEELPEVDGVRLGRLSVLATNAPIEFYLPPRFLPAAAIAVDGDRWVVAYPPGLRGAVASEVGVVVEPVTVKAWQAYGLGEETELADVLRVIDPLP